jgi:FAD-dependent oxidoreductase domain-containing protein 1
MPEKTDVLVIGGGAIGASVAYFVKRLDPGAEVTVVERDPAYTLASTPRASGGVRRLFSLPENIALSTYSIGFFEDFPAAMAADGGPADIGLRQDGYLFIVPPPDREVLRRNFDVQRQLGCRVLWLEPDELKHRFPSMNVADLWTSPPTPNSRRTCAAGPARPTTRQAPAGWAPAMRAW